MGDCSKTKNYLVEKARMTKGIDMEDVKLNALTAHYLGKIMVHLKV